jgi:hypothetical protein
MMKRFITRILARYNKNDQVEEGAMGWACSTSCLLADGFFLICFLVLFMDPAHEKNKNAFFRDTKTQFVPHRRHITSSLQNPAS